MEGSLNPDANVLGWMSITLVQLINYAYAVNVESASNGLSNCKTRWIEETKSAYLDQLGCLIGS